MGILKKQSQPKPDRVPKGFQTAEQWAEREGISRCHAGDLLRRLVKSGEWERKPFRIVSGSRTYPVPHYAPKKA